MLGHDYCSRQASAGGYLARLPWTKWSWCWPREAWSVVLLSTSAASTARNSSRLRFATGVGSLAPGPAPLTLDRLSRTSSGRASTETTVTSYLPGRSSTPSSGPWSATSTCAMSALSDDRTEPRATIRAQFSQRRSETRNSASLWPREGGTVSPAGVSKPGGERRRRGRQNGTISGWLSSLRCGSYARPDQAE